MELSGAGKSNVTSDKVNMGELDELLPEANTSRNIMVKNRVRMATSSRGSRRASISMDFPETALSAKIVTKKIP